MLFSFFKTKQPTPGAEAYAFATGQRNPVFAFITGDYCGSIDPLQPVPYYYPQQLTTMSGLGGPIAGTMYGQPLYVPPSMLPPQG